MKPKSLSIAFLKNVAYFTMFIDHFFAVVFLAYVRWLGAQGLPTEEANDVYSIGRAVGRIAFILFAFMAAEGFKHTHSKKNYLLRLGAFAFLSEIPFDLAIKGEFFTMQSQNVYFTLYLGVFALYLLDKLQGDLLGQLVSVALCCVAAAVLRTDYMFMGVLLIVVFYVCRKSFWLQFFVGSFTIFFGIVLVNIVRYWGKGYPMETFLQTGVSEMYGVFAFILIFFYNGRKGKQLPKACYYLFYPLHLLLLYGVKQWLFG